jgi:hypothetical protein
MKAAAEATPGRCARPLSRQKFQKAWLSEEHDDELMPLRSSRGRALKRGVSPAVFLIV